MLRQPTCRACARLTRTTHLRQVQHPSSSQPYSSSATTHQPTPSPAEILSKPTWSIKSLLSTTPSQPSSAESDLEPISRQKLHHLLRLSALPKPPTPEAEDAMLSTLKSQLLFVREIQSVDTTGVKPLSAIRDETPEGMAELTIGLDTLRDALAQEDVVGHCSRPRRRRARATEAKGQAVEKIPEEDWDVLGTAAEKVGRYFVVRTGKEKKSGMS